MVLAAQGCLWSRSMTFVLTNVRGPLVHCFSVVISGSFCEINLTPYNVVVFLLTVCAFRWVTIGQGWGGSPAYQPSEHSPQLPTDSTCKQRPSLCILHPPMKKLRPHRQSEPNARAYHKNQIFFSSFSHIIPFCLPHALEPTSVVFASFSTSFCSPVPFSC